MNQEIGFIGVGNMGGPMALNLLAAGFGLRVYDRNPDRSTALIPAGAEVATSPAGVTRSGGIVITMVPDNASLEQVAIGDDGILGNLDGGVHVSMSTVSPQLSKRLAELYHAQGSTYVAATVFGRPDIAAAARLSIFVAGPAAAKQRVWPALEAMGQAVHDYGEEAAAANVVKIAANFMIMSAIEGMGEAAALVERYGIDSHRFLEMIVESPLFGGAVYEGYGAMIGDKCYQPALFPVPLGIKDAQLVLDAAGEAQLDMPVAQIVRGHLRDAADAGWGDEDWAVLARVVAGKGQP